MVWYNHPSKKILCEKELINSDKLCKKIKENKFFVNDI